jgi:PTS system nitrogen regulatory IIA component
MSSKDFDIDQLASYLRMTPDQVLKLVARGKLPGRRVGGQWRFPESEIHLWLEEKIGVSDPEQLDQIDQLLERSTPSHDVHLSLAEMLPLEAIAVPLDARTRGSVIREMCQLAARTGLLWDPDGMAESVREREQLHPTALECGVALLHPKRPQSSILAEPLLALGISPQPIPFGDSSGQLTDIFFLICSTDDRVHLRTLARLSRLVSDHELLAQLRAAHSANEVLELVRLAEMDMVNASPS